MTIRDQQPAEFAHVMRGYDRLQVDDYVTRLREYTIELEDRTIEAERRLAEFHTRVKAVQRQLDESTAREAELRRDLAEAGGENLPERLAQILDLAREEAEEVRTQAREDADNSRETAEAEATRIVEDAQAQAEALLTKAATDEQIIRDEIAEAERIKQSTIDQLSEMNRIITAAIQPGLDEPNIDADPARPDVVELETSDAREDQTADNSPNPDPASDDTQPLPVPGTRP